MRNNNGKTFTDSKSGPERKASTIPTHEMSTPKMSFSDNSREEKAENYTDDNYAGRELLEGIDRLCGLATKPRTTAHSDEAQQIIADLEKIYAWSLRKRNHLRLVR